MTPKLRALRIGQAQCGFTLVEGLVAAALVAVAFLVISNLFPTGYSNITYGGNQTMAASYAQQKVEQLKSLSFDSIDAACANVCENLGSGFCRYCAPTPNVGASSLPGDLKKVKITVTWPGQFRPGSLSVDTIFTR
jgi:Tfp pilus assembly protein PilV